jgi:hypothetical protein
LIIRILDTNGQDINDIPENNPWNNFKASLIGPQDRLFNPKIDSRYDAIIVNNHNKSILDSVEFNHISKNKRILIIWEPKTVDTKRYSKKVTQKYGSVFAPSVDWATEVGGISFNWPQTNERLNLPSQVEWLKRKNQVVMILGNKFSAYKHEKYYLRRSLAKINETNSILDIFGVEWNSGMLHDLRGWIASLRRTNVKDLKTEFPKFIGYRFKNFKGHSESKFDTYSNYRFALVIENSFDYVSEKLFDALNAGCIVIYGGPSLYKYGLSDDMILNLVEGQSEFSKLLNLSAKEQYQLVSFQQKIFTNFRSKFDNDKVLTGLGQSIRRILNP